MKKLTLFLAVIFSLSLWAEEKNGIVYVTPTGNGDGSSWSSALNNLQDAIDVAKSDREFKKDVWVAAGEYNVYTCISLVDSVSIYGSFKGTETAVSEREKVENGKPWEFTNPTILKGNNARLIQANAHFNLETMFDGFILTDGNGAGSVTDGSGGAALMRNNVILQNCVVKDSHSTQAGGGVMMNGGGTVRACLIKDNTHTSGANGGGGIFCNTSTNGYLSYIEDSEICGNTSDVRGAGLGIQGQINIYVSNLKIYNNSAIESTTLKPGGGMYVNSAYNEITNCVIYNNSGTNVIYYNGGKLYNNTIVKNVGGLYLAGNAMEVINNIVWGCVTDSEGQTPTSITGAANSAATVMNNMTYNPIADSNFWITGDKIEGEDNKYENTNLQLSSNLSNDEVPEPAEGTVGTGPYFVSVSSFFGMATTNEELEEVEDLIDWSLTYKSPCVNTGKAIESITTDITGLARPQDWPVDSARFDIGAYELPYYIVVAGEPENANGEVRTGDDVLLEENHTEGYMKGSEMELYFAPKAGYKVGRVYYTISTDGGITFTGEQVDFTNDLDADGFWNTQVENPFKVTVEWAISSSLPGLSDNNILVISKENGIEIQGAEAGNVVTVYNVNGTTVYVSTLNESRLFIPLIKGVYLVRIADGVEKVVVK